MMKKIAAVLACAAAFTVATAQFPWETESTFDASAGAQEDNAYDAGQSEPGEEAGGQAASEEAAASEEPAKPAKQKAAREKKAPREKREKPPREKREKAAKAAPAEKAEKADKAEKAEKAAKAPREKAPRPVRTASAAYEGPQKTCPVCVSPKLKGKLYVSRGGDKVHVCSGTCIGRVKRDPAKYINIIIARGEQLSKQ
jgi:hypothetical protein